MEKQKWFYPLQEKVNEYLKENYKQFSYATQVVTRNIVIEMILAVNENDNNIILQSVMNRSNNSTILHELTTLAIF